MYFQNNQILFWKYCFFVCLLISVLVHSIFVPSIAFCQQSSKDRRPDASEQFKKIVTSGKLSSFNKSVRKLALDHIPDSYADTKKWGKKKQFTKYLPKKRKVMLNHGRWQKYNVTFVNPKENLKIHFSEWRLTSSKSTFRVKVRTKLDLTARQSKWIRGVQLYSIHADGNADCEIDLLCEVAVEWDFFSKKKSLTLTPKVISAKSMIHDFRIHRVSKVGGELAQQVTKAAKVWLKENQQKYDQKMKTKLNELFKKKKEKLKLQW